MASFQDMSPRSQLLIFVVLAVVVFFAGEYAVIGDMRAANTALAQQAATIEAQNAALRPYEQRVELLRAENQTLQRQLNTLLTIVPTQQATDQFVRDLQGTAERSAVFIRKIEVKPVVRKDFYVAAPYTLTLDGSFADLQRFYQHLAHLPRIVNVGELNLQGLGKQGGGYPYNADESVTADCTVTTFFSTGAPAAPPALARSGAK